jgi:hypothetical protein
LSDIRALLHLEQICANAEITNADTSQLTALNRVNAAGISFSGSLIASQPSSLAPSGPLYPTGRLKITHGRKPQVCSAPPLSFRHRRKTGRLRLRVMRAESVQVFGRRHDRLSTRRDGRRPKSAKARNRGEGYGLGGAARSAMGIWPCAGHSRGRQRGG